MFVYSKDDKSFYKCLNDTFNTFKQLIPPEYFGLNSESDFAHISTPESLTASSMNMGSRNKGFLMVPNFP